MIELTSDIVKTPVKIYDWFGEELLSDQEYTRGKLTYTNLLRSEIKFIRRSEEDQEHINNSPFKILYEDMDFNVDSLPPYLYSEPAYLLSNLVQLEKDVRLYAPQFYYENDAIWCELFLKAEHIFSSKRTKMKAGRAIRKMVSKDTEDYEVEEIVDQLKNELWPVELTLHSGKTARNFYHAYTQEIHPQKAVKTYALCDSCMHREFDDLEYHPVEVYASGDFEIFWCEDEEGRIAGRTIFYEGGKTHSRFYTSCNQAKELLKEAMDKLGAKWGSFEGGRLVKLYDESSEMFVIPYIDNENRLSSFDKEHFIIDVKGKYAANETDGVLYSYVECVCSCCKEVIEEIHSSEKLCLDCMKDQGYVKEDFLHNWTKEKLFPFYDSELREKFTTEYLRKTCCIEVSGKYWHISCVDKASDGSWVTPDNFEDYTYDSNIYRYVRKETA